MVVADGAVDARSVADTAGLSDAGNLARSVFVGRTTAGLRRHRAGSSGPDRIRANPSTSLVPYNRSLLDLASSSDIIPRNTRILRRLRLATNQESPC